MAPLTNAQRQARYRERLKAQAAGLDLAERAREAIMAAVNASWAIEKRCGWSDFDDFENVEGWIAWLRDPKFQKLNGAAVDQLREAFTACLGDADESRREVLQRAVDLIDAVTLR